MDIVDDLVDVTTALGRGIYSVGEDLVLGIERTAEGLGAGGSGRTGQIGYENELLVGLIHDLVRYGPTVPQSPLFKIVSEILAEYYAQFPEEALKKLAKAAGVGGGYMVGRLIIGKTLATAVAKTIARKIAAGAAFKQLAKKLGLSAGLGATGIGIPVTLLMIQGVAQRASAASARLRRINPALYRKLRAANGLDMLFFLVEKPLRKHLKAIALAQQNARRFEEKVGKAYRKRGR